MGNPYSSAVLEEEGFKALRTLSLILPFRFFEMTLLVSASRRGVGFFGVASYWDVMLFAFSTYDSLSISTNPLPLSERFVITSGSERSVFSASISSLEWFSVSVVL